MLAKDKQIFEQYLHAREAGAAPVPDQPPAGCLSTSQRTLLGQVAESLERVVSAAQLEDCLDLTLSALLPHEQLLCGVGRLKDGRVFDPWLLGLRMPASQVKSLLGPGPVMNWPLLLRWTLERKPLLLGEEPIETWTGPAQAPAAQRPALRNLALHGATDLSGLFISWFCFAGMPSVPGPHVSLLLRLLVPHLHFALLRVRAGERNQQTASRVLRLTERQLEVLHWVRLGKTNAEIGLILQTSEANVKYHLREVFRKLNVTNRAHAVTQLTAYDSASDRPYGAARDTAVGSAWSTG